MTLNKHKNIFTLVLLVEDQQVEYEQCNLYCVNKYNLYTNNTFYMLYNHN